MSPKSHATAACCLIMSSTIAVYGGSTLEGWIPATNGDGCTFYVNSNGVRTDDLGDAVAMEGDWLLIGEPGGDTAVANSGTAYVLSWREVSQTYSWPVDLGALVPTTDMTDGSNFGHSVDILGNYAIVGAPFNSTNGVGSGSAFIFEFDGMDWAHLETLYMGSTNSEFGAAVAISELSWGDHIAVVGSPGVSGNSGNANSFTIIPGVSGTVVRYLETIHPTRGLAGRFGESVSCSGDFIAIGAPTATIASGSGPSCGETFVFQRDRLPPHNSILKASLQPPTELQVNGARFGEAVALEGSNLVVGAPYPEASSSEHGAAYIFTRASDATWPLHSDLSDYKTGYNHRFGAAVAIYENLVVVGSPEADAAGDLSGIAAIFRYSPSGDTWAVEHDLRGYDVQASDYYGCAVAAGPRAVAVGARQWSFGSSVPDPGGLFVYRPETTGGDAWQSDTRSIRPCIPADEKLENAGEPSNIASFGRSIAIDGNTALVGDPYALDGDGNPTGAVHLFTRVSADSPWVSQPATSFPGPSSLQVWDYYGISVALDGDLALVGGTGHNGGDGFVWVFQRTGSTWQWIQSLTPSGTDSEFGRSVAMASTGMNTYWAVGAPGQVSSQLESGKAYLYSWTDSSGYGTHLTTLSENGFIGGYSTFGVSIDIALRSNGYVAIAIGNDWFHDSGAKGCVDMMVAYLDSACGCWISLLEQRIIPLNDVSSTIEGGFAGSNLELDDDALIIGIPYTTKNDYRQGSAAIYRGVDAFGGSGRYTWTLEKHLFGPDGGNDAFTGWDVTIDDMAGLAVLGSPGDDYTGDNAGAAYVYRKSGSNWFYASTLVSLEPIPGDAAGVAVALDGTSLLVGAPGFDVTEEVGDRPHVLGFELVDRSSYTDYEDGSMGANSAWSVGLGGEGNGLFSLWIADPYVVPFDIPTWVGSLRVMLDEVTLYLEDTVRSVTGDVVVAAPSSLRSSLLKLDAGTLLVGNSVLIGTEADAGRLSLSESGALEVIERFVLSDNASVSIALGIPVTNARIDVATSAPELAGALWVSFGPSHDPELLSEGDRFSLISAGVTPTSGPFDAVILPGLPNGLAFEVKYGPPVRRSVGCPAGQIEDCFGNCCPASWLGDTFCDDGTYQYNGIDIYLNCTSLYCDKGVCTTCWDDSSAWEMAVEVVSLSGLLDFGDPNSVAIVGDATGAEIVDLTGDGAEEICVTFAGAPGQLVIFENDGAGGVAQQIILVTGDDPVDISSGDFDGDGNKDLAVANNLSQDVTLYYNDDNDPTNGFIEVDLNVDGPPTCLAGINANFDIYDDLVVGLDDTDSDGNGYWAIYLGDTALMPGGMNDGGGIAPSGIPLGADPSNEEDQKDYVFAGNQSNGKTGVAKNATVLLGGVTLELNEYTTGADPGGISTGDLNGDGQADLAVTSTTNDTVAILRQDITRPGEFLPAIFCPVGDTPTRITAIDFDGDGNLDLATIVQVTNPFGGFDPVVRILQGDGNLSFTSVDTAEGENVVLVDAGDISGDGVNELVTIGGGPAFRSRGIVPILSLRDVDNASCPGDFDSTGDVGIDDLLTLLGEFGSCTENCQSDIDSDNDVDIDDMLALIGVWGPCPR
jgi:hypothetical protein